MIGDDPYRTDPCSPWEEDDLWLRLDEALLRSMDDPSWAWGVAWTVARDSTAFPEVRRAAEELMAVLYPAP